MIFWLVLLLLGVAAATWVVRPVARPDDAPRGEAHSRSLEVLEARYARGDISRDEYLQKKGDILG